jgi:hypothetical protein
MAGSTHAEPAVLPRIIQAGDMNSSLRNYAAKAYVLCVNLLRKSGDSRAMQNSPAAKSKEFGQVLPFRRRAKPLALVSMRRPAPQNADDDFARYEQEREERVDERQRMLMNMIAAAIVVVLISTGVWIADTIAAMGKLEDCALQGRTNCVPIEAPQRP